MSNVSCRQPPEELVFSVITFGIQGFYGTISVLVYCLNIRALFKMKNVLDKNFRSLYVTCSVLSITYFLDHYCIRRYVKLGFFCEDLLEIFGEPNFYLNPYKTIASYCPIAILISHFLIAVHRLTVVVSPIRGVYIWGLHCGKIITVGMLSAFIFMWFMVPCKSYALVESDGGLDIEYKKVFHLSSSYYSAVAATIFGFGTFACTVTMLIMFRKLTMKKKVTKSEVSLIIFEVLMTIATVIYAVTQFFLYYSIYIVKDEEFKAFVMRFRTFAIDVFILPHAWTLLFLSGQVRRYTLKSLSRSVGLTVVSSMFDEPRRNVVFSQAQSSVRTT